MMGMDGGQGGWNMVDLHPSVTGYPHHPRENSPSSTMRWSAWLKVAGLQKDGDFTRKDGESCRLMAGDGGGMVA
jgi:hypothetical protein